MFSAFVVRWATLSSVAIVTTHPASPQPLYVPNSSFEAPATPFVDPRIDEWQKTTKPSWYDESSGFTWDQLFGVFKNTAPGEPDHIGNCDGAQAIYIFAVPEAGIYQDILRTDTTFGVGKSYRLTTGIIAGGGGMTNGASLEMSLYYLDPAGNRIVVAATNIVYDPALFPNQTNLVDVQLSIPVTQPTHAWAGRPMGIRFLSTVSPSLVGGYWDLDNVRLEEAIEIPNASFESPESTFVDNRVDSWQKTPKPDWYDESGGFTWDQLTGVFKNTEPDKDDHLENADGAQAFYLFAVPTAGIYLDESSTNAAPLLAKFEPGKAYDLTLSVQGGGGGMTNGVTLELGLYYRNASGMPQTIATTVVTNDATLFPSRRLLTDFQVVTPAVKSSDAWAGKAIGLQILSTVLPNLAGGYWNIDNARLKAHQAPVIWSSNLSSNELFSFVLQSDPGLKFEVQRADTVLTPSESWTVIGSATNATGFVEFSTPVTRGVQQFYRLRQIP